MKSLKLGNMVPKYDAHRVTDRLVSSNLQGGLIARR